MDPATAALFVMELTCASQIEIAKSGGALLTDVPAQLPLANQGYVYFQGQRSFFDIGEVRVIRDGKQVAVFHRADFKKMRTHPELDFKLQPDDIIDFGKSPWLEW